VHTALYRVTGIFGARVVVVALIHDPRLAHSIGALVVGAAGIVVVATDGVVGVLALARARITPIVRTGIVVVTSRRITRGAFAILTAVVLSAHVAVVAHHIIQRVIDTPLLGITAVFGAGLAVVTGDRVAQAHAVGTLGVGGAGISIITRLSVRFLGGSTLPGFRIALGTGAYGILALTRWFSTLTFALNTHIALRTLIAVVARRAHVAKNASLLSIANIVGAGVVVVTYPVITHAHATLTLGISGALVAVIAGRAIVGHFQKAAAGFTHALGHTARAAGAGTHHRLPLTISRCSAAVVVCAWIVVVARRLYIGTVATTGVCSHGFGVTTTSDYLKRR